MAIGLGAAVLGSAIIGGGASIIGGSKQSKAANQAAAISANDNAANRAFLTSIYNQNVGNLSPYMQTGQTANNAVMGLLGLGDGTAAQSAFANFRNSTGYDWRMNQGTRALQSAFSRNLDSGAATKAAIRYGQGIASDEFGNYYNRVADQARLGFGAASALAGVGQQFGNTVTSGNTAAANAQANARLYAGNAAAQNWANLGSSFGSALGWLAK